MKPKAIKTAVVLAVLIFVLLPFTSWATVDYDSVDAAALPMAAQTDIIQASDQFIRAYGQLLVYDYEEYSGDYNNQNLIGSISASSAVLFIEGDGEDYGFWTGSTTGLAFLNLGYDDDSTKSDALEGDCLSLSNALHRIGAAMSCGWDGFAWCMWDEGLLPALAAAGTIIRTVGPYIEAGQGVLVAEGAGFVVFTWYVVCIMVLHHDFWTTLFAGFLLVGAAGQYKKRSLNKLSVGET